MRKTEVTCEVGGLSEDEFQGGPGNSIENQQLGRSRVSTRFIPCGFLFYQGGRLSALYAGDTKKHTPRTKREKRLVAAAEFCWSFWSSAGDLKWKLQLHQERYRLLIDGTASITGILDPEMRMVTHDNPPGKPTLAKFWEEYRKPRVGYKRSIMRTVRRCSPDMAQSVGRNAGQLS